jgi:hypothetical protein
MMNVLKNNVSKISRLYYTTSSIFFINYIHGYASNIDYCILRNTIKDINKGNIWKKLQLRK